MAENVEILKVIREIKTEIKDEVMEAVVPTIMQVTDAVQNSTQSTEKTIKESIKVFEHKAVPKFHLWVIYPLIASLFIILTYVANVERKIGTRESNLENEVKALIEQLQSQSIEVNGEAIYRIDNVGNRTRIGIKTDD